MNPQIWWYIARASGIIAWLFITAAVLWGILLSTKLFPEHRRPAWLLDLHRILGALSVLFLATHVGALIADSYIQFDIVDILVPFASEWKTWQVDVDEEIPSCRPIGRRPLPCHSSDGQDDGHDGQLTHV